MRLYLYRAQQLVSLGLLFVARIKDITGYVFGRLTVLKSAGANKRKLILWECICQCGRKTIATGVILRRGDTKSCGCLKWSAQKYGNDNKPVWNKGDSNRIKHGMSSTSEYKAWANMNDRCKNKDHSAYKNYGGRGITACDEWEDFMQFYEDMGKKPGPKYTLERIDNEKGYEKSNCKWATWKEQSLNKRPRRSNINK